MPAYKPKIIPRNKKYDEYLDKITSNGIRQDWMGEWNVINKKKLGLVHNSVNLNFLDKFDKEIYKQGYNNVDACKYVEDYLKRRFNAK